MAQKIALLTVLKNHLNCDIYSLFIAPANKDKSEGSLNTLHLRSILTSKKRNYIQRNVIRSTHHLLGYFFSSSGHELRRRNNFFNSKRRPLALNCQSPSFFFRAKKYKGKKNVFSGTDGGSNLLAILYSHCLSFSPSTSGSRALFSLPLNRKRVSEKIFQELKFERFLGNILTFILQKSRQRRMVVV